MSLFSAYEACVAEVLGGRPTKSQAIKLDGRAPEGFDGADVASRLYASLDAQAWSTPQHSVASNWLWRTAVPDVVTTSPEVGLERAIARLDNARTWSFQMSTCSGLRGKHTDKRRAIDLVRDNGDSHFTFVELKVGSDNPLYAAFEIIGYYLAFLRARQSGCRGANGRDVMAAREVELVVLGPDAWFEYAPRRGAEKKRYDFRWMTESMVAGLRALPDSPRMGALSFKDFPGQLNQQAQASHIVAMFDSDPHLA